VRFCLATGQRVGEVCGLAAAELDCERGTTADAVWNIPAERSKNGHPHSVSLSPLALAIIDEAMTTNRARSLSAQASASTVFNVSRNVISDIIWRYGQQISKEPWTAHDLRRSALTGMAKLGIAPIVIGHVANHRTTTKAGITLGIYIQHEYEDEKRDALSRWASRLQTIVSTGG
jgi:integrase